MNLGQAKALPQNMIDAMDEKDRKEHGLYTSEEADTRLEAKNEKEIQTTVEAWLKHYGFWPRSPAFLDGIEPYRGWFIHYNPTRTKGNPIILDLLIWTLDGQVLELELKTKTGKPRDAQRVILDTTPCARIAYGAEEAMDIVRKWIKEVG